MSDKQIDKPEKHHKFLDFDVLIDESLPSNTFKLVKGNQYLKYVDFNSKPNGEKIGNREDNGNS